MSPVIPACLLAALGFTALSADAAEEINLERLASCQDSWLDWKNDPVQAGKFREAFQSSYMQKDSDNGPYYVPKSPKTLLGFPVVQVYPQSIGMAVGFSVVVNGPFDAVRRNAEKVVGKPLGKCEMSEGMKSCELELAPKKTVLLLDGGKNTLVGCAYYYEK